MTDEPLILSRTEGPVHRITLNRPRAINALNSEMFALLTEALAAANAADGATAILLDGAGDRGFCGGGDIKEISGGASREVLAAEYRVDHAFAVSRVPVVSIMDGIAMGGGIGIGGHAAHRVVTERSRLAMPEVRLGIVPDVGGHLLLARAPARLGELLAATAGDMGPGDAIALGFADHFVRSERLPRLRARLFAGESPEQAIAGVSEPAPESPLLAVGQWWEPLADLALGFEAPGDGAAALAAALRMVSRLEEVAATREAAAEVLRTIRAMSPLAVAVTIAQIARTRALGLDLAGVLEDDLRLLGRLCPRPDFREGVRAQVIDKDRNPRWSAARLEDVDPAEIDAVLAPLAADEAPLGLG